MDINYLLILQNFREATSGVLNSFFLFISTIAVDYYILIPSLIIFWTVDKKRGSRILLTWGTSLCTGAFLKTVFCVYRPWIKDERIQPASEAFSAASGYSFPSGHSFSAGGFWNAVAVNYRKNKGIAVFSILMVALTMFSRNYLGVHTPQDVLAGSFVSLLCAAGICRLCRWIDKKPDRDLIVLGVATLLMAGLYFFITNKTYPMDYVDGVLLVDPEKMTVDGFKDPGMFYGIVLGWFIERRFVKFDTDGTSKQKILRALIGGVLAVFWWTTVADPIGKYFGSGIMHLVTQATTPVVCMAVYPAIFKKLEKISNKSLNSD